MNIGNPVEFTIRQLADLSGARSKLVFQPLPANDPRQRRPNINYAQDRLGWTPTIPLREGLQKTISYFEALLREGDPVAAA